MTVGENNMKKKIILVLTIIFMSLCTYNIDCIAKGGLS